MTLTTIGQLRAALADYGDDQPVRIGYQPSYPLVGMVGEVYVTIAPIDGHPRDVVWLVMGDDLPEGEHPYAPRELFR